MNFSISLSSFLVKITFFVTSVLTLGGDGDVRLKNRYDDGFIFKPHFHVSWQLLNDIADGRFCALVKKLNVESVLEMDLNSSGNLN